MNNVASSHINISKVPQEVQGRRPRSSAFGSFYDLPVQARAAQFSSIYAAAHGRTTSIYRSIRYNPAEAIDILNRDATLV